MFQRHLLDSCKKLKKIETNEDNLYVDKTWFQCESETCLKWRVLSNEDASQVDIHDSWFCFMNNDQNHNTCSASEEYYPEESYVLKHGFKYVYSQLPIGSLVLVKSYNWPSWPGILCLDPLMGEYMTCDLDGNVEYYHVEFLGNPHSRKWIKANSVGHYSITLKPEKCKFNKKWYESALQEAYLLYAFSHEQRLDLCLLSKTGMPLVDTPEANVKAATKAKKRHDVFINVVRCLSALNSTKVSYCTDGAGHILPLTSVLAAEAAAAAAVAANCCPKNYSGKQSHSKLLEEASRNLFKLQSGLKENQKEFFKYSFEIVCSDDALLKENIVVSETEDILRDLLQMLEEVGEPVKTFEESYAHGNEIHAEGKRKKLRCGEVKGPVHSHRVAETAGVMKPSTSGKKRDKETVTDRKGGPKRGLREKREKIESRSQDKPSAFDDHISQLFFPLKICFSRPRQDGDLSLTSATVSLHNSETSEEILCENQYEEDCLIIDGVSLKTGECIENITDKFKEIDALMSEF
ncbi:zinc finger CW-type PWWP domain protein 2 [Sarcophilus harrisii]|uniref:zinc finger CW-type PWWP domain protein 2 n=1 Tax=Sarcophilus harrisii TaxID=9305 RepID=UPI001301EEA6|nr:zinc finger CW-type PWWP domain protein 2 [Sarcophilus harrisii]